MKPNGEDSLDQYEVRFCGNSMNSAWMGYKGGRCDQIKLVPMGLTPIELFLCLVFQVSRMGNFFQEFCLFF